MERIGFIGLGVLGSAIVPHLIEAGYGVAGYDIDPRRLADLTPLGLSSASSPRAVAAASDVVIVCLPSVEALRDVVAGAEGIDKAAGGASIVIEISTFAVRDKEWARERLAASGRAILDCPVSGNRIQASRKGLTAFGSGERAVYDRVERILRA